MVLIVALVVLAVLLVGGIAIGFYLLRPTATPTPTPLPTLAPTPTPGLATPTPTLPPTASPGPTATVPPTAAPTLTPTSSPSTPTSSPTGDRAREIARLLALLPENLRGDCEDFTQSDTPALTCRTDGFSHFYYSYPSEADVTDAYEIRLELLDIPSDAGNCFADPTPSPCEGPYKVGTLDPAGSIGATTAADGTHWVVYTHGPARVLGTVLSTARDYAEVVAFWINDLNILYEP